MGDSFPLRWLESNGWLVLSSSADCSGEIRAMALSRCNAPGAIAYVSLADDTGDALMEDMAELGAPSGYLVDLADQDNNAIHQRISEAGMIVIEAGDDIERLKRLMTHTVTQALKHALSNGALVLLEGLAATLAGVFYLDAKGKLTAGLRFVEDVYVAVDVGSVMELDASSLVFQAQPELLGIAIDRGAALVLGPSGHIETWGGRQVTFSLGSPAYQSSH